MTTFVAILLLALTSRAAAAQCPTTSCTATCTANTCNTVFGTTQGRRSAGVFCGLSSPVEIKCTDPPANPSLGYANARAYWCGPGKTQAQCGNVDVDGTSTAVCQGSACLLVDGEYVWNCYEGHFLDINKCSKCLTGQYRSESSVPLGRACKTCSQGAYMDEVGGILCKSCPAGYRVGACGVNDNQVWAPGEVAHSGCTRCNKCPSGQYHTAIDVTLKSCWCD